MRNFSEGSALSITPFRKVQREVIYLLYESKKLKAGINCPKTAAYTLKIMKFLVCISPEHHNLYP